MTRDEIEEARAYLKTYFANRGSDRALFNKICDVAVKGLKPSEYVESLTDEERQLALRWEHIYTEDSYGPQGRNLGILARALLRRISNHEDKNGT